MAAKTRYLQLSLTTMLEYNIDVNVEEFQGNKFEFLYTRLKNGHTAILSPCSYEVKYNDNTGKFEKLPSDKFITLNTINHTAVPTSAKEGEWFIFNDPDYNYVVDASTSDNEAGNLHSLDNDDNKVKSYLDYCTVDVDDEGNKLSPAQETKGFKYFSIEGVDSPKWNNLKLYFSSGYDFSDIYAGLLRISLETNDGGFLDLCNLFYTKSNIYKYITYMTKPIVFGNIIYDKYLNIRILSPSTIANNFNGDDQYDSHFMTKLCNVKPHSPVKIMFSYIENENYSLENIEYNVNKLIRNENDVILENVACYFSRSSSIKGTIPTDDLNSDNLGVYIANTPNYPYIEFYGTWKDTPLNSAIVHKFNTDIMLYDKSLIRRGEVAYEVDEDYTPEYNMKKWIALHEIQCDIIDTDKNILKSETYTQSQAFLGEKNETVKFYYRPIIFDDYTTMNIVNSNAVMTINYTLRFMNIEDSVQFTKTGSMSLYGNSLFKFCGKTTTLNFSDRLPYKVYNKIINQTQELTPSQKTSGLTTKYIKTFYDSTTIVLDVDGVAMNNNSYVMTMSQAPKNYKFVFKKTDINGNTNYLDLSDTYYKLYTHDAYNNEIVIEPTYSNNMNLLLGELEFNINSNNLNKMKEVPASDRKISIVAYNTDNSVSSMYDMMYTF